MDGVEIISTLLRVPGVTDVAPANVKGGELPEDAPQPALLIRSDSLADRDRLKRGPLVHSTERIAVTVRAATYREMRAIIRQVRTACAGLVIASMGDAQRIAILPAGMGPERRGGSGSFERTQDFRVSYDAPA
jgi:hypothetical protein